MFTYDSYLQIFTDLSSISSMQEHRQQWREHIGNVSPQMFQALQQRLTPLYGQDPVPVFTPQEQHKRRQCSEKIREALLDIFAKHKEAEKDHMQYYHKYLLDTNDTPEAQHWNERVKQVFVIKNKKEMEQYRTERIEAKCNDGMSREQAEQEVQTEIDELPARRGALLMEIIERYAQLTPEQMTRMINPSLPPEQLAQNLKTLDHVCNLFEVSSDLANDSRIKLTDEQKNRLSTLANPDQIMNRLIYKQKLSNMANPYYEYLDIDKMLHKSPREIDKALFGTPSLQSFIKEQNSHAEKGEAYNSLRGFFDDLSFMSSLGYSRLNTEQIWEEQNKEIELENVKRQLRAQGANQEETAWNICDASGDQASIEDIFQGKKLYVQSNEKVWEMNFDAASADKHTALTPIEDVQAWKQQIVEKKSDNIRQQLGGLGANAQQSEWKIFNQSGHQAKIEDVFEGKTIYVQSNDTNWEIKLDPARRDQHPVITTPTPEAVLGQFNQDYAAQTDGLKNALEGAELWMRGSKEYKDIKKNLGELTQFGQLGEHPTVYQCEQLRQHLQSLQESSEKYLATKGEAGRNEREQKRIDAAQQVKEFASRKLKQLSCLTTGLEAKQKQSGREASAFQQSASSRRVQQDNIGRALDAKRADPEVIKQKAQEFCNLPLPVREADLIRPELKLRLEGNGLNKTLQCAQSPEDKLTGANLIWAKDVMLNLTAMALVEHQVKDRHAAHPNDQLGQKLFDCRPSEFVNIVKANPVFQHAVNDLSPQRFGNFIAGDGARKLSQQMLDMAKRQKEQANKSSQPAQQHKTLEHLLSSSPHHKQSGPTR